MDFRSVQPSAITWSTWSRGQPVARVGQGGKVVAQTPLCPCRVSVAGSGMYRLDLVLRQDLPTHSQFCGWLADIEDSASEALKEWRGGRSKSTCVYNNSMRLMAFSDTLAFDSSGKLSADLMSAGGCACIIELQGCWSTEARWGLRWKIVQIKFVEECSLAALPAPVTVVDDDTHQPSRGPTDVQSTFAFLDD